MHASIFCKLTILMSIRKDWTLSGNTTPSQSGSGSNSNEEVPFTPQISRTGASSKYIVQCHIQMAKINR